MYGIGNKDNGKIFWSKFWSTAIDVITAKTVISGKFELNSKDFDEYLNSLAFMTWDGPIQKQNSCRGAFRTLGEKTALQTPSLRSFSVKSKN